MALMVKAVVTAIIVAGIEVGSLRPRGISPDCKKEKHSLYSMLNLEAKRQPHQCQQYRSLLLACMPRRRVVAYIRHVRPATRSEPARCLY